jgi:hypothetical protein
MAPCTFWTQGVSEAISYCNRAKHMLVVFLRGAASKHSFATSSYFALQTLRHASRLARYCFFSKDCAGVVRNVVVCISLK